ncbi:MAG: hypothetical protein EOS82_03560 [Mesorhizobium sp.]|nr:MAG: hypothetical protein EOS82_03560 [Mesorhizobium sp.]TIM07629.1 MAG: hypothetical protein E5Y62_18880 [Mesorhizobium sp.]TIM09118.1 MAG: hypothetical protein E5Y62_13250 [Mesorhizobium sp.]
MRFARALRPAALLTSALLLVGCGTSGVSGVPALRLALGSSLAGAQGKTAEDQNRIDRTMAPGCAIGLYRPAECDRHTKASADRRGELKN